jgi:hypothetical protein
MLYFTNLNGAIMQGLYKKLSCNNLEQINQQILLYLQTITFDQDTFWNPVDVIDFVQAVPEFVDWCRQNQLMIKTLAVTQGFHDLCCGPHTDTPPCKYKLSWPVSNTSHTWNRWFQAQGHADIETNALGGVTYLNPNQLKEIGRMQVDQPALIAVSVPHDVWFDPLAQYPRIGLQCQLFTEPLSI